METVTIFPFSFEFVTTEVQWMGAPARIKGWWKRPDGTIDGESLLAEVTTGGTSRSIQFPFERVPDKEWQQCVANFSDDGKFVQVGDAEVEQACSLFEPQLLIRADKPLNIRYLGPTQPSQTADAWEMRKEFLKLKLDCDEVAAFLNKWGSWDFREYVLLPEMENLQQTVSDCLTSPPEIWFATDYSVPPMWQRRRKSPFFSITTDKCEIALRMTVTIDLLNQKKFKTCARPDCGTAFEVTSNHSREYCLPYCSHLESVRRKRKTAKQQLVKVPLSESKKRGKTK
jgi:hypothetical protein